MNNRRPALTFVILILLLATYFRFHLLGAQSFWNDEGNSYVQATRSFADIATHAARDIHPPGYYWLLGFWRLLTGETEFAMRSLSAFASILTVAFIYALGKRLYGALAGVIAALLVTLNTFNIYYAQEARMYALLALWAAASLWALVGFLSPSPPHCDREGRRGGVIRRWALALALLNAAGLWTQYAYPFVMLAQGVMVVLWLAADVIVGWVGTDTASRVPTAQTLIYFILANLLTIALYLPWLPTAYAQVTAWPNTGDETPVGVALGVITGWLIFGVTATKANFTATAFLLVFLLVALIPVSTCKRERIWWRGLLPVLWVLLPVGLFLALGLFREGNIKLLLPAQIGLALWIARGVDATWGAAGDFQPPLRYVPRLLVTLALLTVVGELWSGLYPLYHGPDFQRDDYRGIVRDISAGLRPGDAIILDAPNQAEVFHYYYHGAAPVFPLPPGLGGNDLETAEVLYDDILLRYERIYVLFWGDSERDPNRVVETTLDTETFPVGSEIWYGDVRLALYSSITLPYEPATDRIRFPVTAYFGENIHIEGYSLNKTSVLPGDIIQIAINWRTDAPISVRYKVFVHLLDPASALVAQRDSEPVGDLFPTTTWEPQSVYTDRHGLLVPPDLSPGEYTLILGLYDIDNPQARLPVGDGDYLRLATIVVS